MTTLLTSQSSILQLRDCLTYPPHGILSTVLLKDNHCQYTLFCLAAGTEISQHTSPRNATLHVLEGHGTLTLESQEIILEPGLFVFMPANAPHALNASENLAFLLTLSEATQP